LSAGAPSFSLKRLAETRRGQGRRNQRGGRGYCGWIHCQGRLGADGFACVVALLRERVVAAARPGQALAAKAHGAADAHILAVEETDSAAGEAHAVNAVTFAVGARSAACGDRGLKRGRVAYHRRGGAVIDLAWRRDGRRQYVGRDGTANLNGAS